MKRIDLEPTEILRTSRLVLRTWTIEDSALGFEIWGDPNVMKYVDSGEPQNIEQVQRSIEARIKHQEKFGYQHWAVVEIESNCIIGACGFNSTENPDEVEMVFHFNKKSWGKGFASEAAEACLDFIFSNFNINKVIAGCHPDNQASIKVLTKLGFSFIGNKWFADTKREEPCFELARSRNHL